MPETEVMEPEVITPDAKKGSEAIARRYSSQADGDLALCQSVTVETDEQFLFAAQLRLELSAKVQGSESARDALVRPLNDHVRWINSIFKPAQEKWKQGMGLLSQRRLAYERAKQAEADRILKEQQEVARKEQERLDKLALERAARAEAKGDTERAAEILETVPQVVIPVATQEPVIPKVKGIAKVQYFHARVTNIAALVTAVASGEVPMDALLPNEPWLNKTASALRMNMKYPGVEVWDEWKEKGTGR